MDRVALADFIFEKISSEKKLLMQQFQASKNKIGYFYIDNLLIFLEHFVSVT